MSIDKHQHTLKIIGNIAFGAGETSFGFWMILKNVSVLCATLLPITGVISFVIYLVINFNNIADALENMKEKVALKFSKKKKVR